MDAQTLKFEGWDHSGLANFLLTTTEKVKCSKSISQLQIYKTLNTIGESFSVV